MSCNCKAIDVISLEISRNSEALRELRDFYYTKEYLEGFRINEKVYKEVEKEIKRIKKITKIQISMRKKIREEINKKPT